MHNNAAQRLHLPSSIMSFYLGSTQRQPILQFQTTRPSNHSHVCMT